MAVVTNAGRADIASASFQHIQTSWSTFVIGDGYGTSYVPTRDMTSLKHQVYEGKVAEYKPIDDYSGFFELVIPANEGGFMVREIGLLNDDRELVALSCLGQDEAQPKLQYTPDGKGHFSDITIHFGVAISNTDSVKVVVDPNTTIATQKYVNEQVEEKVSAALQTVQELLDAQKMSAITNERIMEIVGMEFSPGGGPPTIIDATPMSSDTIEKAIDDDPSNDPKVTDRSGSLSEARIKQIIGD